MVLLKFKSLLVSFLTFCLFMVNTSPVFSKACNCCRCVCEANGAGKWKSEDISISLVIGLIVVYVLVAIIVKRCYVNNSPTSLRILYYSILLGSILGIMALLCQIGEARGLLNFGPIDVPKYLFVVGGICPIIGVLFYPHGDYNEDGTK